MMTIESPGAFWKDYELIDSGNFEKLERFGPFIMARPEPKALCCHKIIAPAMNTNMYESPATQYAMQEESSRD